jgi:hypothetical protein
MAKTGPKGVWLVVWASGELFFFFVNFTYRLTFLVLILVLIEPWRRRSRQ